jgi:hypothetical protein
MVRTSPTASPFSLVTTFNVRYKQKISQLCCDIRVAKKWLAVVSQMVIISEPLFWDFNTITFNSTLIRYITNGENQANFETCSFFAIICSESSVAETAFSLNTTLQIYIAYTCSGLVNCWMGGGLLSGLAKSAPPILILAKICYPSAQMI